MKIVNLAKIVLFSILFCHISNKLYSQEESSTLIEAEMLKIQEDFQSGSELREDIPQSQLLEEILKPGNENLLEQIKSSENLKEANKKIQSEIEEDKDGEEDKDKDREEDKKLKISPSDLDFQNFDRKAYFESIKEFYGYNIFLNNFEADSKFLPVNSDHIVGPGDKFVLSIWGEVQNKWDFTVNNEGSVFIPDVGVVFVHGSSVSELQNRMKKILAKSFNTIDPPNGNPTSFFDLYFSEMQSINVYLNGEVISPGAYIIQQGSNILSALILAKGISSKGTMRSIKIIRNGKIVHDIDLYEYLLKGKGFNEITIRNNDNIFVGTRLSTISLKGEVFKPLKYELKENESLADLIRFSGGLLSTSGIDRIKIERIVPFENRTSPAVVSKIIDTEFTEVENNKISVLPIKLYDNDIVEVYAIPRILTDYVSLSGAVYRKGRYAYEENMSLKDIIGKAGGLLADAYLEKIELVRTYPDLKTEYVSLNFNDSKDFILQSKDSLNIYSKWTLKSKKVVIITGYIKNPGFEFLSDSTRISDLIFSRGGIEDKWRRDRTYMLRAELTRYNEDGLTTKIIHVNLNKALSGDKKEDLFLQDGDRIRIFDINVIFQEPQVTITGYVKSEGDYLMSTNMTVEDLILKARGFKEGAYKLKAIVFRKIIKENKQDSLSSVFEVDFNPDFLFEDNYRKSDFILQNNDHVVVRRNPDYHELRKVFLSGHTKFPGVYTIIKKDETLRDLIKRAGGLTEEAFIEGTEFFRDSIRIVSDFRKAVFGNAKNDILLRDGDQINIPSHPGTVIVEGYVYTPGYVKYRDDWDAKDYVEAAGGTISEIEYIAGSAIVYYPGGNAKVDNKWLFSTNVKEGSRIVVPKIKRPPELQWANEIRTWMGVLTSTLTIVVLVAAIND